MVKELDSKMKYQMLCVHVLFVVISHDPNFVIVSSISLNIFCVCIGVFFSQYLQTPMAIHIHGDQISDKLSRRIILIFININFCHFRVITSLM